MIREIAVDEHYTHVGVFDQMKRGDVVKVPYEKKRYSAIRAEKSRRNREARLTGELMNNMDLKFRVSATENPGYITIFRIK